MSTTISSLTLPASNLALSMRFYSIGLGLAAGHTANLAPTDDHVALELDNGSFLVLILRPDFEKFSELTLRLPAPAGTTSRILSDFTFSREEVDLSVQRCGQHGGTVSAEATDHSWGYAGYQQDPDGHPWEIMYNPKLIND